LRQPWPRILDETNLFLEKGYLAVRVALLLEVGEIAKDLVTFIIFHNTDVNDLI
jgi:hypothetical protein